MTIGPLPDDTLLEIFSIYVNETERTEEWHTLGHVCRRWRNVVFASPRRLDLRLFCTESTPVREMLNVWPSLPIIIKSRGDTTSLVEGTDDINLWGVPSRLLERFAAVTEEPSTTLRFLLLESKDDPVPVLPETFLGGSAPHLRSLYLRGISFPALPRLLLSASELVKLSL